MILKILISCCVLAAPLAALAAEPAQQGMTVVRDPQTGKLRAPTAAELRALGAVRQPSLEAPHAIQRADGTRAITLGERGLVYSVMTRNADGSTARRCIKGSEAATHALEPQPERHHDQ
jgi:hypothetical protein